MSWLQAPPTKPAGQVQMARPLRGLVSHTAPSLQGLLTHASSRWHSKPMETQNICQLSTFWQPEVIPREGKSQLSNPLTSLSNWALAEERCYAVMAGGTIEANSYGTVINILTAVISRPTINTDTGMTPNGVEAGAPIMARIRLHETLVDILSTVLPCVVR